MLWETAWIEIVAILSLVSPSKPSRKTGGFLWLWQPRRKVRLFCCSKCFGWQCGNINRNHVTKFDWQTSGLLQPIPDGISPFYIFDIQNVGFEKEQLRYHVWPAIRRSATPLTKLFGSRWRLLVRRNQKPLWDPEAGWACQTIWHESLNWIPLIGKIGKQFERNPDCCLTILVSHGKLTADGG